MIFDVVVRHPNVVTFEVERTLRECESAAAQAQGYGHCNALYTEGGTKNGS